VAFAHSRLADAHTLDLSAVPVLRERTHLPVIVDPSHAAGRRRVVAPLREPARAVGAHGVMIEIHPEPDRALSDGPQSPRSRHFEALAARTNSDARGDCPVLNSYQC